MKSYYLTYIVCIILLSFFTGPACTDEDQMQMNNTCVACDLEPMVGPCNAAFPRYYFDKTEEECNEFIWGGCNGVVPFETLEECELCACND